MPEVSLLYKLGNLGFLALTLSLHLRHFKNLKNIDYFNNKNKVLKYILSIWQISAEIGDLRLTTWF
jgi:hypothetical protein